MGSAFHQLCPRYSGTLAPTAPTAIRLWETFTFFYHVSCLVLCHEKSCTGISVQVERGNKRRGDLPELSHVT